MPNLPGRFQWALVDIETTGGRPTRDKITEIAIIVINQDGEINRWQTLVNPEQNIPAYIQQFTGITNEMVADAPIFEEIAETVSELLVGSCFVAHNARFDYGFIKNSFTRLNRNFSMKVICSVRLSRKLFPDYKSHSMDNIIKRHGLCCDARHRAMGDADLIKQFLELCFDKFGLAVTIKTAEQIAKNSSLPSRLNTDINNIPNTPGVYLFYSDINSLPIYIGKSKNLRTRILSHFSSDYTSNRESKICHQTQDIKWIETAGELGALMLESRLVKEKMPIYNRRLRKNRKAYYFIVEKKDHYLTLNICNEKSSLEKTYGAFATLHEAKLALDHMIREYQLCPKLLGVDKAQKSCFYYQLKKCKGACLQQESAVSYNLRMQVALNKYQQATWPYQKAIAVKEYCSNNELQTVHVFQDWQYYGAFDNYGELELIDNKSKLQLDNDEIKILKGYLKNNKDSIKLINLDYLCD